MMLNIWDTLGPYEGLKYPASCWQADPRPECLILAGSRPIRDMPKLKTDTSYATFSLPHEDFFAIFRWPADLYYEAGLRFRVMGPARGHWLRRRCLPVCGWNVGRPLVCAPRVQPPGAVPAPHPHYGWLA
jgi:hypothetical protein